ncbi:MAG: phosphoheptose isomerase [Methylophilaceae bacterium]|jgi:D-sedoheptulose 7-phosphate isomerase|uniref:phosphoheptose isomerase n=1 Tax=Methylobacillus sp. MM3 TaxID=1848039 RepID=UPI0007E063B1|nr:phosphoheptose isomerase [Methylobacillus sp. MM3]OAJ70386.1 phosphoheptose isomerase [Methylobacillus sp. MM3]
MNLTPRIVGHFEESAQLKLVSADLLAPVIAEAAAMIVAALLNDKKVLTCGNGGSAALAQYFAARMLNRFDMERPGLATISLSADNSTLTSIANDSNFSQVFSKQIMALGQPGDILLAMSTSGNSQNVLDAIVAAHERGMNVVAFSGGDGGSLMELLIPQDIHIGVPHENTARVQEMYLLVLHCLCDSIDCLLLGVE